MFRAWHQHPTFTPTPDNIAICSLLHNISLRGEKQFFFSFFPPPPSTIQRRKKGSAFSGCQGWGHWAVCASFTSQPGCQSNTHAHSHTHWTGRGRGYFSSVYYIETPWHWGPWLHHGSPWTGWHIALIFLSGGISEWRHRTVHETLIHLSNVYFSTSAECRVTVQRRQVNTATAVLQEQSPVSHLGNAKHPPRKVNYNRIE